MTVETGVDDVLDGRVAVGDVTGALLVKVER